MTDSEKKWAIFLATIGPKAYKLLCSLLSPTDPGEKEFEDLVKVLKEHYNPPPSEIVQWLKFNSRFRRSGESVADYVAELRAIAQTCNFGTSLEEMLRDRLVCGIGDHETQQRLLSEPKLTWKKALELAQGIEATTKNVKELQVSRPGLVQAVQVQGEPWRAGREVFEMLSLWER